MYASIYDAEIVMESFQLYRADRAQRQKECVAPYLRANIAPETIELSKWSDGYIEHLMLHMKKYNFVVANVNNPPGTDNTRLTIVMNLIKENFLALGNPQPSLVICFDFNFPGVTWGTSVQDNTNSRTRCMTH